MMKRFKSAIHHTGIWITKDGGCDLIRHTRPWLLWRRRRWWWCYKGCIVLSKGTTKLRATLLVRCAGIGSKRLRGIKVFIACIALLKWCRWLLSLSLLSLERKESCWDRELA
jgi:hypothetical protein